jgi:hypothetical protein
MTLSFVFNSKSQIKRRAAVETESIGAQSLSRFFSKLAARKIEQPAVVEAPAFRPVVIRRGMNI